MNAHAQSFTDVFGVSTDVEMPGTDTTDVQISADECISLVPSDRDKLGICVFSEYTENDGYRRATATWERKSDTEEKEHELIVFGDFAEGWHNSVNGTCIDLAYLEQVAAFLDTTVNDVCERALTYRNYPIVVPSDMGYVVITPLAIDEYEPVDE